LNSASVAPMPGAIASKVTIRKTDIASQGLEEKLLRLA
jgi:hypothetical protein